MYTNFAMYSDSQQFAMWAGLYSAMNWKSNTCGGFFYYDQCSISEFLVLDTGFHPWLNWNDRMVTFEWILDLRMTLALLREQLPECAQTIQQLAICWQYQCSGRRPGFRWDINFLGVGTLNSFLVGDTLNSWKWSHYITKKMAIVNSHHQWGFLILIPILRHSLTVLYFVFEQVSILKLTQQA